MCLRCLKEKCTCNTKRVVIDMLSKVEVQKEEDYPEAEILDLPDTDWVSVEDWQAEVMCG